MVIVAPVLFVEGKMIKFQQPLWGFELTYPDHWAHRSLPETEGFAASPQAFEMDAQEPGSGHILIRSDWNGTRQPVEQLWNQHIGQVAGMLLAKNVGSAAWKMGGASGYEAEIILPKRESRRLWAGMLNYGFVLMQFMVSHPIEDREWFEPAATEIIKSLRFPRAIDGINENDQGIPIPPDYQTTDPRSIIPDIKPGDRWSAYAGASSAGSLQAFYVREMLSRGWLPEEFVPFPGPADLGFARLNFIRPEESVTIGIMPDGLAKIPSHTPARVVVRYHS
jgi:hypothetical protein